MFANRASLKGSINGSIERAFRAEQGQRQSSFRVEQADPCLLPRILPALEGCAGSSGVTSGLRLGPVKLTGAVRSIRLARCFIKTRDYDHQDQGIREKRLGFVPGCNGQKKPGCFHNQAFCLMPDNVLLSHGNSHTTIGAKSFHC